MLEHLFSKPVLDQFYDGPLAPFLYTFTCLLSEKGYTNYSIKLKIRLVAKFSRWPDQQNLGVSDLKLELFDHFIKYQKTANPVRRGDLATLKLLLRQLSDAGVIPPFVIKVDDNPFYQIENGFAQYLSHERGLSPET